MMNYEQKKRVVFDKNGNPETLYTCPFCGDESINKKCYCMKDEWDGKK